MKCVVKSNVFSLLVCVIFVFSLCPTARCQSAELADLVHNFVKEKTLNGSNLDEWVPPEEMTREFTYYQSGYDDEERPIWIAELGRWNVKKYFDAGGEKFKNYDRYVDQFLLRIMQSVLRVRTTDNPISEIILIIDCEGFLLDQLTSARSIIYHLTKVAKLLPLGGGISKGYILNTTYLIELAVNLVKPIAGNYLERFEFYGTSKAKWIPKLLKDIPRSQLPPAYGGKKDFKPVAVFG